MVKLSNACNLLWCAGGSSADSTLWLREMFGTFLSLNELPSAQQAKDALQRARQAGQGLAANLGGGQLLRSIVMPVLQMLLPDLPMSTISLLSASLQSTSFTLQYSV